MTYKCLINKRFSREDIVFETSKELKHYPEHIKQLIEDTWEKLQQSTPNPEKYLYNGIVYSLCDYKLLNDKLVLKVQPTDYKSYIGTNIQNIKIIKDKNNLANILAACVVPITSDDYCIVGKRSNKLAEGTAQWHVVGGTVESKDDNLLEPEHPYDLILKELKEEINVSENQINDLVCTGFGLSIYNNKPEFLFKARLSIGIEQLRSIINLAKDYDEHSEYRYIKTDELNEFVSKNTFSPIGELAIKMFLEQS